MIRFYPVDVSLVDVSEDKSYTRLVIQPLARGYSITLGNALRRVLLSSIEGSALTYVEITAREEKNSGKEIKILHEFTTIPNVVESVTELILNLRSLPVRVETPGPKLLRLSVKGYKEVKGKDITVPGDVKIVDPNHYLFTVERDTSVYVEMGWMKGRGYVPAENHWPGDLREEWRELESFPPGVIPVDSDFQPVKKVVFSSEPVRVGRSSDYEKLFLEVWTDKTLPAEDAIKEALLILMDYHLAPVRDALARGISLLPAGAEASHVRLLEQDISTIHFSTRTHNILIRNNIRTIGDLISLSPAEFPYLLGMGKKTLKEIQAQLKNLNLSLRSDQGKE